MFVKFTQNDEAILINERLITKVYQEGTVWYIEEQLDYGGRRTYSCDVAPTYVTVSNTLPAHLLNK